MDHEAWVMSYGLLWTTVAVLATLLLMELRAVGKLHRLLPPSGASVLHTGPALGTRMAEEWARTLSGAEMRLGGAGRRRLYVFIHVSCPPCAELMPALRSLYRSDSRNLEIAVLSLDGDLTENERFVSDHRLTSVPYGLSPSAASTYGVWTTPYVLLLDDAGYVVRKGVANHLEHLESLVAHADGRELNLVSHRHH